MAKLLPASALALFGLGDLFFVFQQAEWLDAGWTGPTLIGIAYIIQIYDVCTRKASRI